jgi:hypothetical protein
VLVEQFARLTVQGVPDSLPATRGFRPFRSLYTIGGFVNEERFLASHASLDIDAQILPLQTALGEFYACIGTKKCGNSHISLLTGIVWWRLYTMLMIFIRQ